MTSRPSTDPDRRLISLLQERGGLRVDPPILQPAGLFLDLSGEDIRRRLFLTQSLDGRDYCLRPEYTIPVCREHVRSGLSSATYCYLGPVFRQRPGESGEFLQAGYESIGREDRERADAEALAVALAGVALYSMHDPEVTVGDLGILEALLVALEVPPPLQRRLVRRLSAGQSVDDLLAPAERSGEGDYAGLLAAIEGQDPRAARAFVEDVISIAGIARVGGRSAGEIADRFLTRAANRTGQVSERAREVLGEYLRIDAPADRVPERIGTLGQAGSAGLEGATERYRRRLDRFAQAGLDVASLRYSARFARSLDYYTGLIFEIRRESRTDGRFVVAGGRYDRLLQSLGATGPTPAVGCSFWLDRLGEASR